jgi:hypothetical protein
MAVFVQRLVALWRSGDLGKGVIFTVGVVLLACGALSNGIVSLGRPRTAPS